MADPAENKGDDKGGQGGEAKAKQGELPLGEDKAAAKVSAQDDKATARLRAAEEENAKLRADLEKRERDEKASKAAKEGKLKEELDRTNAELAKMQETNKSLAKAARDRVERLIERLPKADQEEIALVKGDLPYDKLEALVERRLTANAAAGGAKGEAAKEGEASKDATKAGEKTPNAPATPGIKGSSKAPDVGHEIHPETKSVMQKVFAQPEQYEIAKHLGVDSSGKFGWERTDNEDESKANFIHLLNSIAVGPTGPAREQHAYDRVLKKAR